MKRLWVIDAFRPADGPPPQTLWRFFLWCLSGSGLPLVVATFFSVLAGTMEVVTAWFLGRVVDVATTGNPPTIIADHWPLFLFFGIFLVGLRPLAFGLSAATNAMIVQPNVLPLVLSRLHRWTMGHAVTFFDNDFAGRIATKQMQAARAVTDVASEMINTVAFAMASLVGSAIFLLSIDNRIALALTFWIALYLGLIWAFLPRIRGRSKERAAARAMITGQVVDTITNIKTVKLFAHADYEDRAAIIAMSNFRDTALEFGALSSWFRLALMTLAGILPVILSFGALYLWSIGSATTGDIAAAGTVSIRIAQMTGWVSFALINIYSSVGEVEDGMRTLTPPHTLADTAGAKVLGRIAGEITFDDVSFAYGRNKGGLDRINLTVRPGEKLGIVGASGAGKSTLVALLLRLYDAEQGRVLVDGQDVRGLTQESLRRQVAMVTQETAMFNRSARDNIMYGRPDATEDEMIRAATQAEADDFIRDLQDFKDRKGYDAHLGERGVKLSGGQRQRIALARAFLKDAPILVLDEATSALDSEVEAQVQGALHRIMQGKTVLAIAHRLSTIAEMDRIVVLDQGRIVEEGDHTSLLAKGGLYARYWNRQSGGFIGVDEAAE